MIDALTFIFTIVLPKLLQAIPVTLGLTVVSCVVGNLMAVPIAMARISPNPFLWMPSYLYILLMRGTPLLVQIYLIYYGLGQILPGTWVRHSFLWPYLRDGFWYAIVALSLNTAGYTGEILRGAIQAVPHGEIEAGKAFGMSPWLVLRRITLPRAIRICLPTMSTETILLLKSTSLAATITVMDVLGTARWIQKQTFRIYEPLIAAGLIYVTLVFILTRLLNWLERSLNKDRDRPAPSKSLTTLGNA
ncbi:MAG: ABC transporter permease [Rhodospirillaceae bacterium]|nr:MAG: ABC transporter permease [Rhodospirillaceae bacterium]